MKKLLTLVLLALVSVPSFAERNRRSYGDVRVDGYTKRDGTVVEPYYRSKPNANRWDNYDYEPSQPKMNTGYQRSGKTYGSDWYTPNSGRTLDSNPNNDYKY